MKKKTFDQGALNGRPIRRIIVLSLVVLSACHPLLPGTPFPEYDNQALHQDSFNDEKDAQQKLRQNWYNLYDNIRSDCVELNKLCNGERMYQSLLACVHNSDPRSTFQCYSANPEPNTTPKPEEKIILMEITYDGPEKGFKPATNAYGEKFIYSTTRECALKANETNKFYKDMMNITGINMSKYYECYRLN